MDNRPESEKQKRQREVSTMFLIVFFSIVGGVLLLVLTIWITKFLLQFRLPSGIVFSRPRPPPPASELSWPSIPSSRTADFLSSRSGSSVFSSVTLPIDGTNTGNLSNRSSIRTPSIDLNSSRSSLSGSMRTALLPVQVNH